MLKEKKILLYKNTHRFRYVYTVHLFFIRHIPHKKIQLSHTLHSLYVKVIRPWLWISFPLQPSLSPVTILSHPGRQRCSKTLLESSHVPAGFRRPWELHYQRHVQFSSLDSVLGQGKFPWRLFKEGEWEVEG